MIAAKLDGQRPVGLPIVVTGAAPRAAATTPDIRLDTANSRK